METSKAPLLCDASALTWPFMVNTIFLLFISLISILGNVFVFFVLHRSRSLHFNVRLLLKNFLLCAALLSLYTAGKAIYNFYVWMNDFVIMTEYTCGVLETHMLIIVTSMILSIAGIGAERVINTIWKSKRRDVDKPSAFAYLTLAFCWTIAVFCGVPLIAMGFSNRLSSSKVCYCEGVRSAANLFIYFICPGFVFLEAVTVTCYLILYKHSRSTYMDFTINTTQHSLARRYQMLSNIRTTTLLTPTILVHGTTYFILAAIACYLGISQIQQRATSPSMMYMLIMVDIPVLEAATHPFLLLARHEYLLKTAAYYLPILNCLSGEDKEKNGRVRSFRQAKLGAARRTHGLSILPSSNRMHNGVVEFRMKPENHEDILNFIWETKDSKRKKSDETFNG